MAKNNLNINYKKQKWKDYGKEYALDHESDLSYWEFKDIYKLLELDKVKGATLLDFGCNTGDFMQFVKERNEGIKQTGIDINKFAIERAKKKYPKFNFIVGGVDKVKGKYDYIVLIEVIEHIKEPVPFLKQLKEHLSINGKIIMSTPNRWAILPQIGGFISGKGFCYDPSHFHQFSPLMLKKEVKDSGLKVIKVKSRPLGVPALQKISRNLKESMHAYLFGARLYVMATNYHPLKNYQSLPNLKPN